MRKPAKTFEDLLVWQKAHLFVLAVYRLSPDSANIQRGLNPPLNEVSFNHGVSEV
ncbi:MAG: four helix bundle protein [Bacillota bacterium]|jgi:hypothetical protein